MDLKKVLDCLKEGREDAYVTSLSFFSQSFSSSL